MSKSGKQKPAKGTEPTVRVDAPVRYTVDVAINKLRAIAALSLDERLHPEIDRICEVIIRQEFGVKGLRDHINKLKIIHPPKLRHNCPEWDEMEIDEYDEEFMACLCFDIERP